MSKKYPIYLFLLLTLALVPPVFAQSAAETITAENGSGVTQLMRLGRGTVTSLAFSPDGATIAVASSVGTWLYAADALDTPTDPTLLTSATPVTAVAFSPDGRVLAAAEERLVRVWDAVEGTELAQFEAGFRVDSLTFSPDSAHLVVGDSDYVIRVWDVLAGTQVRAQEGHSSTIYALTYSPDGSVLASGGADNSIRLWDMSSGAELMNLSGHTGYVNEVAFSPDGQVLVSVSDDDTIRLWNASDGTENLVISEFKDAEGEDISYKENMNTVAFAPDGSVFAVGSDDDYVRVYDLTGEQLAIINTEHDVESLAFSPDGSTIATVGYDITVALWDAAGGTLLSEAVGHTDDFDSVSFSPDGASLIIGNSDGNSWLWDVAAMEEITALPLIEGELSFSAENATGLTYSPDGSYVAFVDGFDVQIWEPDFSAMRTTLTGDGLSNSLAISPDSSLLVYVGSEGVFLFDVAAGTLLAHLTDHTDWVQTVAWSPDQSMFATGASDGTVRIWTVGS